MLKVKILNTDNILLSHSYFSHVLWAHQPTIYHPCIIKLCSAAD